MGVPWCAVEMQRFRIPAERWSGGVTQRTGRRTAVTPTGAALAGRGWRQDAYHEAAAVSIGGQQHGLVTLDGRGEPVRPAMLWNDVRSAPQARRLIEELGGPKAWAERTGSVPGASFTVTKWAWLAEHEPEAVRALLNGSFFESAR